MKGPKCDEVTVWGITYQINQKRMKQMQILDLGVSYLS